MTKKEFVKKLADRSGLTQTNANIVIDSYADVLADALAAGEDVTIMGVGKFIPVTKEAHTGRNPKTGEAIQVAEKKSVKFKLSGAWKDKANK